VPDLRIGDTIMLYAGVFSLGIHGQIIWNDRPYNMLCHNQNDYVRNYGPAIVCHTPSVINKN